MTRKERIEALIKKIDFLSKTESGFYEMYDILVDEINIEQRLDLDDLNHYLRMLQELKIKEASNYKIATLKKKMAAYENFYRAFLNTLKLGLVEKS